MVYLGMCVENCSLSGPCVVKRPSDCVPELAVCGSSKSLTSRGYAGVPEFSRTLQVWHECRLEHNLGRGFRS